MLNVFDAFLGNAQELIITNAKLAWRDSALTESGNFSEKESSSLPYNPASSKSITEWLLGALRERLTLLQAQRQRCRYCQEIYTPYENLGRFACTYHPGYPDYHTHRFTCCNGIEVGRGCRKCDHTPDSAPRNGLRWTPETGLIKIPYYLINYLHCREESIVPELFHNEDDPARSYVLVSRVQHPGGAPPPLPLDDGPSEPQ